MAVKMMEKGIIPLPAGLLLQARPNKSRSHNKWQPRHGLDCSWRLFFCCHVHLIWFYFHADLQKQSDVRTKSPQRDTKTIKHPSGFLLSQYRLPLSCTTLALLKIQTFNLDILKAFMAAIIKFGSIFVSHSKIKAAQSSVFVIFKLEKVNNNNNK